MARAAHLVRTTSLAAAAFAAASSGVVIAGPAAPQFRVGVPAGFDALAAEQHAVLDIYMGGRQVGTAEAVFAPGQFRFADPAAVAAALPGLAARERVIAALSGQLADNRALACRDRREGAACRPLRPEAVAIVFDESRFRVEVFVNPALLETRAAVAESFLPAPVRGLSLTQGLGLTLAGTAGSRAQLAVADSVLVGLGPARLRADLGWQTGQGAYADTLAVETDRRDRRWTAGLFWAPGTELTGRRKLLGVSLATQFDTRLDRDQLQGTPLIVYLDERSRVDAYVGGRLVSSGLFEAGNQALDTSGMPEGSYEVVLRIAAARGGIREERRQFTRSPAIPPLGHDAWGLTAGALVDEGRGGSLLGTVTRTPYVQASWAHRLGPHWALGLGVLGTDQRQMVQARAMLAGRRLLGDASLLVSAKGDYGAFARIGSQPGGRLSFNFDARLVTTRDGRPLLPAATPITVWAGPQNEFGQGPLASAPFGQGSRHEAEVSGDVAWQLGRSRIALVGSWRQVDGQSQYAIGPSLRVPLLRARDFEIVGRADYAETERGHSGFVGISLMLTRGNKSFSAESGLSRSAGTAGGPSATGSLRGTISGETGLGEVQGSAALTRDEQASYASADVTLRGRRGELAAGIGQALGGVGGTQYALSLRTAVAAAGGHIALGRIDGGEARIMARVEAPAGERFELLVNDVPRAALRGGAGLTIDLPAYRSYDVRLRAAAGSALGYDGATRRVTLFPGNVAAFLWQTRPQLAIYARLVAPDGAPLANAALSAGSNIADTAADGGFMLQLDAERTITAHLPDGTTCTAQVPDSAERDATHGFASLKALVCERQTMPSLFAKHREQQP